jgi:urease accessory protein
VKASARVEVVRRGGRDVVADLRSEPPLTVRRAGDRVLVVGSAAGPVGGDELALDVAVGPGATLTLGTVAATMAWPGPTGAPSSQSVHATVADGGHLAWVPEPLVLVARCRHHATTEVHLRGRAAASILEEVTLGRSGEEPGTLHASWRVTRDGRPLLHHAEHLGPDVPGWGSAVSVGRHRHLLAAVTVGTPAPQRAPVVSDDAAAAVLAIAPDAWVLLAVGADRVAVQQACAGLLPGAGLPVRPGPAHPA